MPVIKADSGARPRAFSLVDIERHARLMLLQAKQQAEQILAEAQAEAEAVRAQARQEGHAQGHAEGLKKGTEEGKKQGQQQALNENKASLQALVKTLTAITTGFEQQQLRLEAQLKQDVVKLALQVAARITRRQAALDPAVLAENLRGVCSMVVGGHDLRIAVHPSQRKLLQTTVAELKATLPNLAHAQLVEDAQIAPGGCRIGTARGVIDADIEAQIQRVIDDLLPAQAEQAGS